MTAEGHHARALREYRERELAVLAELEQHQIVAKYGGPPRPVDVGLPYPRRNEDA